MWLKNIKIKNITTDLTLKIIVKAILRSYVIERNFITNHLNLNNLVMLQF